MTRLPIGSTHGRLTILGYSSNGSHPLALVRCTCGTEKAVQVDNLARTHSCGCIRREQLVKRSTTHGMTHTPEYRTWADMIDRCTRTTQKAFEQYGGRGITVCQAWLDSFQNFFTYMGPRPTPKHTLDRIDNEKGYSPDNCRWATAKEQRINQRRMVLHTFNGVTGTLKDLAALAGRPYDAVKHRMQSHWTIQDALYKPLKTNKLRTPGA